MANISPAGSKALVNRPARRILWALIGRELSVNELAAEVGKLPAGCRSTWPSCR